MATNPPKGPGRRGAVRKRSQVENPRTGLQVKRSTRTGRILGSKTSGGKFKGVRKAR
jgi:hypothetical protein